MPMSIRAGLIEFRTKGVKLGIPAPSNCEKVIPIEYLEELDDEIGQVADVLQSKGSHVVTMAWEDDRGTTEERRKAVEGISNKIRRIKVVDPFLDFHARVV